MTRKSPAKAKVIKTDKWEKRPELPPIEETFENIKQVLVNTAEVQVRISYRVDNLLNIRAAAYKFWGNELDAKYIMSERVEYFKELLHLTAQTYIRILDTVRSFELEEFLEEDMKDYFEDITPTLDDVVTEDDMFRANLVLDCIKPWGEKMNQLHYQMMDEKKQREFEEE